MALLPQSSVDRRLLQAAREYKSPNEMSEMVLKQLTPAQCALRVQELLDSKTVLDEVQERRLLLISIAEHVEWLRERRSDKDTWNSINRAYKLLSDQIERTNVNVNDISTKLAEEHARIFVESVSIGMSAILKALSERDIIDVDPEEQNELLELATAKSSEYLSTETQRVIE